MAKKHLEDLLADVSFVRWIRGEASPKENVKWKAWLQKDPEHQHLENDARELITFFQEEIYEIPDAVTEWKKVEQLIDHEEMKDKILQKRKERHFMAIRRTSLQKKLKQ